MLEKHALPDQIIIKCLNTNYGIAVVTLTFLPIRADTNASIYKAQTFDQTSYFIKLKLRHHHDISVEIVELLQQKGIHQTIPLLKQFMANQPNRLIILLLLCTNLLKDRMVLVAV